MEGEFLIQVGPNLLLLPTISAAVLREGAVHQLARTLRLEVGGQLLAGQLLLLAAVGTGDGETTAGLHVGRLLVHFYLLLAELADHGSTWTVRGHVLLHETQLRRGKNNRLYLLSSLLNFVSHYNPKAVTFRIPDLLLIKAVSSSVNWLHPLQELFS